MAAGSLTHGACVALFLADLVWRSVRVRLMLGGAGSPVGLRQALALTAFGDAAAIVTPWRSGGEVARALGARAAGVSLAVAGGVLGVEFLIAYAVAGGAGAWLAVTFGAELVSGARGAQSDGFGVRLALALLAVGIVAVAFAIACMPKARRHLAALATALMEAMRAARKIPLSTLAWCGALSFAALVARLTVLPLLASTAPGGPSFGVLMLASFALLYAQIATPTPAGTGAVEFAFLSGAMGLSGSAGSLLGWWRVYTTLLPVIAGVALGGIVFGRGALTAFSRGLVPSGRRLAIDGS